MATHVWATRRWHVRLAAALALAGCTSAVPSSEPPTAIPTAETSVLPARPSTDPTDTASPPAITAAPRSATPVPGDEALIPLGPLPPGDYRAHIEPGFSFTIGTGWERRLPEPGLRDRYLMLFYAAGGSGEQIWFEITEVAEVADALEPFAALPNLTAPREVTLGGLPALTIDAGPPPTVTVLRGLTGEYVITGADVVRVTVARVREVVLRVIVESNEADADAFRPIAEQVLGTLSFD